MGTGAVIMPYACGPRRRLLPRRPFATLDGGPRSVPILPCTYGTVQATIERDTDIEKERERERRGMQGERNGERKRD